MLRAAPYFTNVPIPVVNNWALSSRSLSAYGKPAANAVDRNMLFQYKKGDPATSFSSITGMALGQFDSRRLQPRKEPNAGSPDFSVQ